MTQIIWTVLMLLVGGVLGMCLGPRFRMNATVEATPTVIGKITELADLVVLRVPVSNVHVTQIGGYVGGVDCIVLVNGELELGTDLKLARWLDVDTETRTATLVLAEPVVRRARLDHEQTSVYRIDRRGLWLMVPSAEPSRVVMNQAMAQAQHVVESAGEQPVLMDRAKQQTEQVLSQLMAAIGWEVKLEWAVEKQGDGPS
jgi:hypothetical protein